VKAEWREHFVDRIDRARRQLDSGPVALLD
jgi:hypothetical protein